MRQGRTETVKKLIFDCSITRQTSRVISNFVVAIDADKEKLLGLAHPTQAQGCWNFELTALSLTSVIAIGIDFAINDDEEGRVPRKPMIIHSGLMVEDNVSAGWCNF